MDFWVILIDSKNVYACASKKPKIFRGSKWETKDIALLEMSKSIMGISLIVNCVA